MSKTIACLFLFFCLSVCAYSAEFFPNGALRKIEYREVIESDPLIGGYPIYTGQEKWQFEKGNAYTSTGGTRSIKMGGIQLAQFEGSNLFAAQYINATTESGTNTYWTGDPCKPPHLVIRKGALTNREDHCMTIDPVSTSIGNKPLMLMNIVITQSGSQGRYYKMELGLNLALLGFLDTGTGDWTAMAVSSDPRKAQFIDALTKYAEVLFNATNDLMSFSRPTTNVFEKIPSYRTLVKVPSEIADQKYSLGFLGALEDISHRADFSAIAFSQYKEFKTPHGYSYGMASKDVAEKLALENCEKFRPADAPPCKLYEFNKVSSSRNAFESSKIEEKIRVLKELLSKNLITQIEYDAQLKVILDRL